MTTELATEERRIQLSKERAERLRRLAQRHQVSEDQVVASALDILFGLAEVFDEPAERQGWSLLSADSLARVWDNEEDAAYDNWRELYGVPAR